MAEYQEALEKMARQEYLSAVFWSVLLLAIIVVVWVSYCAYSKKDDKKKVPQRKLAKFLTLCRQSLGASIAATVISLIIGIVLWLGTEQTVSDIQKDIRAESYITYHGEYRIEDPFHFGTRGSFGADWTVELDNGDYAFVYIAHIGERATLQEGSFNGRVVYGEHSRFVVEITDDTK